MHGTVVSAAVACLAPWQTPTAAARSVCRPAPPEPRRQPQRAPADHAGTSTPIRAIKEKSPRCQTSFVQRASPTARPGHEAARGAAAAPDQPRCFRSPGGGGADGSWPPPAADAAAAAAARVQGRRRRPAARGRGGEGAEGAGSHGAATTWAPAGAPQRERAKRRRARALIKGWGVRAAGGPARAGRNGQREGGRSTGRLCTGAD